MKKLIHWMPRILTLLAICFVSLFALDSFDSNLSIMQQIIGFLMHLIPSLILLILLGIAWRYQLAGGIIFVVTGVVFGIFLYIWNFRMNHNVLITLGIVASLALPFLVSGILFMLDYRNIRKGQITES